MSSFLLINIILMLAIIGSSMFNVWRRRRELNRLAYAVYSVGGTWALVVLSNEISIEFGSPFEVGGWYDDTVTVVWLLSGAIGGTISWWWWRAHQAGAATSAGAPDHGPAVANSSVRMLPAWGRAVTLVWLGGLAILFVLGSIAYGHLLASGVDFEFACVIPFDPNACFTSLEAAMLFGASLAAVAGSILLFGRLSRLGIAERSIYVAAVVLAPLAMFPFWASVM